MNRMMLMTALLGTAIGGTSLLYGDQPQPARPGTVNYVDGSAFLDGSRINSQSIGQAELDAGQVLTTQEGKAEILLTPGIFLRVGEHSAIKMISPEITPTIVEVQRGRAAIEVDEIYKQNDLEVVVGGVTTCIAKKGYYEFRASQPSVLVYKGEARVDEGDGRYRKVKGGHELALAEDAVSKPTRLNAEDARDSLFQWSSLRSQYLSEANRLGQSLSNANRVALVLELLGAASASVGVGRLAGRAARALGFSDTKRVAPAKKMEMPREEEQHG